jgi:hypothetical protein
MPWIGRPGSGMAFGTVSGTRSGLEDARDRRRSTRGGSGEASPPGQIARNQADVRNQRSPRCLRASWTKMTCSSACWVEKHQASVVWPWRDTPGVREAGDHDGHTRPKRHSRRQHRHTIPHPTRQRRSPPRHPRRTPAPPPTRTHRRTPTAGHTLAGSPSGNLRAYPGRCGREDHDHSARRRAAHSRADR